MGKFADFVPIILSSVIGILLIITVYVFIKLVNNNKKAMFYLKEQQESNKRLSVVIEVLRNDLKTEKDYFKAYRAKTISYENHTNILNATTKHYTEEITRLQEILDNQKSQISILQTALDNS